MNRITTAYEVPIDGNDAVQVTVSESGQGDPVLLLHGGGGPLTVDAFADQLALELPARVLTPIHPGFSGTPRSESLASVRDLGRLYAELLATLDLTDVTVVGNSIGGWIAAEIALRDASRVGCLILVDGVGIEVSGHPVVDFFSLTPREVAERSYYDPDRYGLDPSKLPPQVLQAMAGNRAALAVYGGSTMSDPSLAGRLAGVKSPTVVIWGDSDRIADADYGRALTGAIPGAEFRLLPKTGHLPQVESPRLLLDAIRTFTDQHSRRKPT